MKSNKVLVFLAILTIMAPTLSFGFDISLGAKGGLGHFTYRGADYKDGLDTWDLDNALRIGFTGGIFATIGLVDMIAIQPEVLFLMGGDAYSEDAAPWDGKIKYTDHINYLSIPVLVKVRFGDGIQGSIFAGPNILLKLGNGKSKMNATDSDLQDIIEAMELDEYEYDKEDYESLVIAAVAGAEIGFPVGTGYLVVDARYQLGFTNILNEDVWTEDFKSSAIILMVGFRIPVL